MEEEGEERGEDVDDGDSSVIRGITEQVEKADDQENENEYEDDLDTEGRVIAKVFPDFVLVSVYTPHSGVGDLKRLQFRVERWDRAFEAYINRLK